MFGSQFIYFNSVKKKHKPIVLDHGRNIPNRPASFTKKPRPTKLFNLPQCAKSKDSLRITKRVLKAGDLCIEMSLGFISIALLQIKAPVTMTELIRFAKLCEVPYFNLRKLFGMRLLDRLHSVQLNNSQLLSDFFVPKNSPSVRGLNEFSKRILEYLDGGKATSDNRLFLEGVMLRICKKLFMPKSVFSVALTCLKTWDTKKKFNNYLPTNKGLLLTVTAFVVFAAKLILKIDLNKWKPAASYGWDCVCADKEPFLLAELRANLDELPQPDGMEHHRVTLLGSFDPRLAANLLRGNKNYSALLKEAIYCRGEVSPKPPTASLRGVLYLRFVSAAARLAGTKSKKILDRVKLIETKFTQVEKMLTPRTRSYNGEKHRERGDKIRATLKFLGPCSKYGPMRFLRRWEEPEEQVILYDCMCGNSVPNKYLGNIVKHRLTANCIID